MKTPRRMRKYDLRFKEGKINSVITSLVLIKSKVRQQMLDIENDIERILNSIKLNKSNNSKERNLQ